jgi:hypothetical protein
MYQSLIWPVMLGDDASRLRSPLYAKRLKSAANSLVDRMRRDFELGRDFLRTQVLVHKQQAVELATRQTCNAGRHCHIDVVRTVRSGRHSVHQHSLRAIRRTRKHPSPDDVKSFYPIWAIP